MLLSNKRTQRYLATGILLFMVSTSLIPLYAFCNDENAQTVEAATFIVAPKASASALALSYSAGVQTLLPNIEKLQSSETQQQKSVANEDVIKQDNSSQKVQSSPEPEVTPEPTPEPTVKPTPTPEPKDLAANGQEYVYYEIYDDGDKEYHSMSKALQKYTYDLCIEYGIEEYFTLILAQLYHESRYDAEAISATNDYGIAQINKCNHSWLKKKLGITDFLDPYQSILANIYMMSDYLKKYGAEKALVCYNTGSPGRSTTYSREIISRWNNDIREKE